MNATIRRIVRAVLAVLAVGVLTAALAGQAFASHVLVRTAFPSTGSVGQIVSLAVDIHTPEGAPLAGTTVTYYLHMSFAGVEGEAEIGQALTDDSGIATISYQPRAAGTHQVRMEYLAPGVTTPEEVVASFEVAGGEQLYQPAEGVDVPGINSGLLMVVLGAVWLILLSVAFRLVGIARAGREVESPPLDQPR
jgi:hypothetical protein